MDNLYKIQPLYAFVELKIGETVVSSFDDKEPDTVMDLTFERVTGSEYGSAGSKFTITLYDDNALEIEELVSSSLNASEDVNLTVNYGWAKNSSARISESSLQGVITQYELSFEGISSVLSIAGTISSIAEARGSVESKEYDAKDYGGKPSNVVTAICDEEGWEVGYIEETEPCADDNGNPKSFSRNNINAGKFIKSLCEESVSAESGSAGYIYFHDEDGKIYFVSEDNTVYTEVKANKKIYEYDAEMNVTYEVSENKGSVGDVEISGKYEFYSGRPDNTVISFTPEFRGKCVTNTVPGKALTIDPVKNEMIACSIDGKYIGDDKKANRVMGVSSSSFKNLEKCAKSMWSKYGKWPYTATMEIIGDPTVKIHSNIYVAVYTKYGFLHHTSGIYSIKGAEDNISGGTFITTLNLIKLGNNKDDMLSASEAEAQYAESTSGNNTSNSGQTTEKDNTSASSNGSFDEKSKYVTGGRGINRLSDSKDFCSSLVTTIQVKCRDENGRDYMKSLTVNKYLADNIRGIFNDIYNTTTFRVKSGTSASFCYRSINNPSSNSKKLSYHSYGVAIDLNSGDNPFSSIVAGIDDNIHIRTLNHPVVKIFKKYGWGWGGVYRDYMHFSYFNGD